MVELSGIEPLTSAVRLRGKYTFLDFIGLAIAEKVDF